MYKKILSDSNLNQLPESTANLIRYRIIKKSCSYLCQKVMWFWPKFSTRNSVLFGTHIHIPCGSNSLFLHPNEHSRLMKHFTARNNSAGWSCRDCSRRVSLLSSRKPYFVSYKLFTCWCFRKYSVFLEAIDGLILFSPLSQVTGTEIIWEVAWSNPPWLKQIQHLAKF